MWTLRIKKDFAGAHQLKNYDGACSRLHGHRWDIEFFIKSPTISSPGNMICDFKILKEVLESILPDHQFLNDIYKENNPTAEVIVRELFYTADNLISSLVHDKVLPDGSYLAKVVLWENSDCGVEYER